MTTNDNDLEKEGYLLKKTSKGLWVNRYFVTEQNLLAYWHDQHSYQQGDKASEKYDLAEVKSIEKTSNRGLVLSFLNSTKFKLELRTMTDLERNEWHGILDGKGRLYSIDELLSDLQQKQCSFQTNLFQTLLALSERDRNKWVLDLCDEWYEIGHDESTSQQLRSNSCQLLQASCQLLDHFIATCEDCKVEIDSRQPKIIAHSKNFIKRYAEILKGRLTLELLYLPGIEGKEFEALGERALCFALELAVRIESLSQYSFVPKELLHTINRTLFSSGDLISALMNLSIKRVDAFFEEVQSLAPSSRSKKLLDLVTLPNEILRGLKEDLKNEEYFHLVLRKMVETQFLGSVDHLLLFEFDAYEETSLIEHIQACDQVYESLKRLRFDLQNRTMLMGDRLVSCSTAAASSSATTATEAQHMYHVSNSVLDAIKSACDSSAKKAFLRLMHIVQDGKKLLLRDLLHESAEGWIGGILCNALINNIAQWVEFVKDVLPERFAPFIYVEVSRLLITMYIHRMMQFYHSKDFRMLSTKGMTQIQNDLRSILFWIQQNTQEMELLPEKNLLTVLMEHWIHCTEANAHQGYAHAVRLFGLQHAYALYDLLRLFLKFRIDIQPKARKAILAICTEYLAQLQEAVVTDPQLLAGEFNNTSIFETLFPRVGIEHCTGTKWKMEKSSDPTAVKLSVTLLVTDTCNQAMAHRRRPSVVAHSNNDAHRSIAMLATTESSSTKTGDVSAIKPSRPPPPPRRTSMNSVAQSAPVSAKSSAEEESNPTESTPTPPTAPSPSVMKVFESVSINSDVSSQEASPIDEVSVKSVDVSSSDKSSKPPPPKPPRRPSTANAIPDSDAVLSEQDKQQKALAILLNRAKLNVEKELSAADD